MEKAGLWDTAFMQKGESVMDGALLKKDDTDTNLDQRNVSDIVEFEYKRQSLREERLALAHERREFERECREFERERREFSFEMKMEKARIENESRLFDMKWKLLEEEVKRLADDKQQFDRQRDFFRQVEAYEEQSSAPAKPRIVPGEMFFIGVESKQALKKRYKDLIKIYHPDNLDGDTGTIQEINREYDRLQAIYP